MATREQLVVNAAVYVHDGSDDPDSYWVDGDRHRVFVERSGEDDIRVGVLCGRETEAAGFYLNRDEAVRMILALAGAVGEE